MAAALLLASGARAQQGPNFPPGGEAAVAPGSAELRSAQDQLMKTAAPELYAFQRKLRGLQKKIDAVERNLAAGETTRAEAREQLLPLVRERQEILVDPEYLTELRLAQVYFASPEYRKKAQAAMRAISEKPKQKRRPAR